MEAHGPKAVEVFGQALAQRKIDPYAVRLPDLVESFLGRDYFTAERKLRALASGRLHTLEATDAVDASAFSNITGQLLITVVREKYESPEFVGSTLVKTIPNPGSNLKDHKVPYLSDVDTAPKKLNQLEPYPQAKFAESWVTMPPPEKYGHLCQISMETAFSDLTGQAQDSAASVGRSLGYNREQRILKVVLGIDNPYKWNDNALTTYVDTAGTGSYVNKLFSNTISNYTQINNIEQLFWRMVDPITGRLINVRPTAILCMPEKLYDLKRVLNATETRTGNQASDSGNLVVAPNPLEVGYKVTASPIARSLLIAAGVSVANTKERVYFGDFQKAFFYREVYPLRVEQAPPQNPMEFMQDVALAVKASEFGVPGVYDPRYAALSASEAS